MSDGGSPAGRVRSPLPLAGGEARRRNRGAPDHEHSEAVLATRQPALDHHLVSHAPKAVENRLEVITMGTTNDPDPHPRPALLDYHRQSQVADGRLGQRFRIGAGDRRWHRKSSYGQRANRLPVISAETDGGWRVRGGHTALDHRFQHGQHALGSPVAHSRKNRVRLRLEGLTPYRLGSFAVDQGGKAGRVDNVQIHFERRRRFRETLIGSEFGAGGEQEQAHRYMVPQGYRTGILIGVIQGNLDRLHFGDLLQWLQMGGLSGRLTVHDPQGERRLDFLDGRVVYASSTVPDERFASWLARRSLVPAQKLRRLLAIALLRRSLFSDLLITEGVMAPHELQKSLTDLAETITSRILYSPQARFEFDPAYPIHDLLGLCLDVEPRHLLMEAARRSDEDRRPTRDEELLGLPLTGEAFESFFWELAREGIVEEDPVDGEQMSALHNLLRDIVGTLAQWLASSPGLVPLPPGQIESIALDMADERPVGIFGLPHATWNQMVLGCSVRSYEQHRPRTLIQLEETASAFDLWMEMTGTEFWRRPQAEKLDDLTRRVVVAWSRAAAAAAPHLGIDPATTSLAAHLVAVPTDLVLWVLSTLPVPHLGMRQALLNRLPRRVGSTLARLADFPESIRDLFDPQTPTPLGVCLHLGRERLPSATLWPATVPDEDERLLEIATPGALAMASDAVREVSEETSDDHAAIA